MENPPTLETTLLLTDEQPSEYTWVWETTDEQPSEYTWAWETTDEQPSEYISKGYQVSERAHVLCSIFMYICF